MTTMSSGASLPSWDVDPAGVQAVLTTVAQHAQELSGSMSAMTMHLQAAGANSGSAIVGQALADFMQWCEPDLVKVAETITSALNGTVAAVQAYADGDMEMATQAQAAAATGNWSSPP